MALRARLPLFWIAPLMLSGLLGCMPGGRTFDATSRGTPHRPISDSAAASTAIITRTDSVVEVQHAYRFDLRHLVDVDRNYEPTADSDETSMTRDEAVVSMAIHGAFGLGTFNAVLDRLDTPWAKERLAQIRVGKPFFVRSLSKARDDYWVVPVFYKDRWAVASHVGVTPTGTLYSNGFTVPNMEVATSSSELWGRGQLMRWAAAHALSVKSVERIYLDRSPVPRDAVLSYVWWVREPLGTLLVDVQGATASLTPAQLAVVQVRGPLDATVSFEVSP